MDLKDDIASEVEKYDWHISDPDEIAQAILDLITARLHECDDLPPSSAQQACIEELEAQLAAMTAERDNDDKLFDECEAVIIGLQAALDIRRAAIPRAYAMGLEDAAERVEYHQDARNSIYGKSRTDAAKAIRALTPPADLVERVLKGGE